MAVGTARATLIETGAELQPLVDQEHPGLVVPGTKAIDDDTNQVGQMLAALADLLQGIFASKVEVAGDKVDVTREVDKGLESVSLAQAAVITTDLCPKTIKMAEPAGRGADLFSAAPELAHAL